MLTIVTSESKFTKTIEKMWFSYWNFMGENKGIKLKYFNPSFRTS